MLKHLIRYHKALTQGHNQQLKPIISIINETRSIHYILINLIQPRYQLNIIIASLDSPLKITLEIIRLKSVSIQ